MNSKISVDAHLAFYQEKGIEPAKPFSGKFNLRIGPELYRKITVSALEDGVSLNEWIKQTLEKAVER